MTRFYLLFLCLVLSPFALSAQITNAQVNYELYVDQWQQTCDNDGFSSDDNEVKVGLTSDANTGGTATWTSGGNGASCGGNNYVRRWQADAPSTVTNNNTRLYRCINRTNAANTFVINHESWEEDGSADCSRSGDACQSSGTWTVTFKSAAKTPNRFWSYGGAADVASFVTGQSGNFSAKTVWRYTNGTSCGNALNFGTLASGTTYSHVNSNRTAPTGSSADLGYSNTLGNTANDVYYQFVLSSPATVTISTDNAGSNYDTYLRLYNSNACGTQIAADDDSGSGTLSLITTDLCAGTYVILVEGFSAGSGDFNLSVVANNVASAGGTIAGGTSPSCSGTDPGAFTSSNDGSGIATLVYQWEQSTTSSTTGFSNIGGATATTYDIPVLTQTTWFRRRVTDACGRVAYSNVRQITVNTLSTAPTTIAGTTTICEFGSTVLTASGGTAGTGATFEWFSGSCGSTVISTNASITVNPSTSTTYFVRRRGTCNTTACISQTVTVNTNSGAPVSMSATQSFICPGGSSVLTVNGGLLGTGANYVWYAAGCGSGAPIGTGTSVTVSPTSTTLYYVRIEGTCNTTTCASGTIFVRTPSTTPTTITGTTSTCGGFTNLTVSGGTVGDGASYFWYTNSCGGTPLANSTSISVNPATTTTYFVRLQGTCNNSACISATVTVGTPSTAPSAVAGTTTICNGGSTTLTQAGGALGTGGVYRWYSASCGGTLVGTGNSITVSPTANTTYFVRAEGTCNTTSCASVAVTVNTLSTAPTGISGTTTICNGGSTTLTRTGGALGTGGVYRWYSASCGGTLVGTGNSITVSPTANTTYFVRAEGTCNTTSCASVAVVVNTPSTALSISPVPAVNCPNTTLTLSGTGGVEGTGAVTVWYSAPNGGGTLLGSGNSINVTPQATTTYYARREGTCNTTTDASVVVSVRDYIYATNNTSANTYCTDASGWHHFYTGSEIILSLQGDLSSVTNMTATINTNPTYYQDRPSGASPFSCANGWTPGEERFEMPRNWNIAYTGTLNGTYNVRYYYPPAERTVVETAAQNWAATYPACGYSYKYNPLSNGWFWFKNTSGTYVAPQFEQLLLAGGANGVAGTANYSVITGVTSFSGGSGAVILVPDNRLPIELLSFSARYANNQVLLNWTTGSERNNNRFEVERSRTGAESDFEQIGIVAGQGDSQAEQYYQLVDNQPYTGVNYYRLRQVDNDGTFTYSYIVAVETPNGGKPYTFFPNPTTAELTYQFVSAQSESVKVEVINALGQVLFVQSYTVGAGQQQITLDMSAYPDAAYIIRAYHANGGEVVTETILKKQP
jgi:hypothetical protein